MERSERRGASVVLEGGRWVEIDQKGWKVGSWDGEGTEGIR
jgi:hypothetical protein